MVGLQRLAISAAMYRTLRTSVRPPAIARRPRMVPRVAVDRRDADQGGDAAPVDAAELGQLGDQGAGGDRADAGDGGEQILGHPPGRRAA